VRFVNLGKPTDELVLVQRVLAAVGGLMASVETQPGLLPAGWHHAEEAETENGTRRTLRPRLEVKPAEMIPARIIAALERERTALREILGPVKRAGTVDEQAVARALLATQEPARTDEPKPAKGEQSKLRGEALDVAAAALLRKNPHWKRARIAQELRVPRQRLYDRGRLPTLEAVERELLAERAERAERL
jgi:hypothetical protein